MPFIPHSDIDHHLNSKPLSRNEELGMQWVGLIFRLLNFGLLNFRHGCTSVRIRAQCLSGMNEGRAEDFLAGALSTAP